MAAGRPTTHPFPVQQQVGPEDGSVADGHLLVPVGDLEDAAVHGALVDAGRVQAAALCKTGGRRAVNSRTQTPACSVSVRPEESNARAPFSFLRVALVRPRNRSVNEGERWPLTSHNGRAVPGEEERECENCASLPMSRLPGEPKVVPGHLYPDRFLGISGNGDSGATWEPAGEVSGSGRKRKHLQEMATGFFQEMGGLTIPRT